MLNRPSHRERHRVGSRRAEDTDTERTSLLPDDRCRPVQRLALVLEIVADRQQFREAVDIAEVRRAQRRVRMRDGEKHGPAS